MMISLNDWLPWPLNLACSDSTNSEEQQANPGMNRIHLAQGYLYILQEVLQQAPERVANGDDLYMPAGTKAYHGSSIVCQITYTDEPADISLLVIMANT